MEWRHPDDDDDVWNLLQSVTTSGLEFGHAECNLNSNATSRIYFCNGGTGANDDLWRWNGAIALINSTTADTITVYGSTSLANLGFSASGTIIINGTQYTYSGLSGQQFTGVSGDPTGEAQDSGIAEIPVSVIDAVTYPNVTGNILLVRGARMFMAGINGRQMTVRYSQYRDPEAFGSTGSPTDPTAVPVFTSRVTGDAGLIEINDGTGPLNGLIQDEEFIYLVKKNSLVPLKFAPPTTNQTSGSTPIFVGDNPVFDILKAVDGKGQTNGGINQKSMAAGSGGILLITEDKQILYLTRAAEINTPQLINIGKIIQPTLTKAEFDRAASIFFKNKFYISCRSSDQVTRNDTVLVYDVTDGIWDLPWQGISVADWNIYANELHWVSDTENTSYKQITDRTDNALGFTSSFYTHLENFGVPMFAKECDFAWLFGAMTEVSEFELFTLFNREGVSGQPKITLSGNDPQLTASIPFNTFGANPFAYSQFGSNPDFGNFKFFNLMIELSGNIEAHEFQLALVASEAGSHIKILGYGFHKKEQLTENSNQLIAI